MTLTEKIGMCIREGNATELCKLLAVKDADERPGVSINTIGKYGISVYSQLLNHPEINLQTKFTFLQSLLYTPNFNMQPHLATREARVCLLQAAIRLNYILILQVLINKTISLNEGINDKFVDLNEKSDLNQTALDFAYLRTYIDPTAKAAVDIISMLGGFHSNSLPYALHTRDFTQLEKMFKDKPLAERAESDKILAMFTRPSNIDAFESLFQFEHPRFNDEKVLLTYYVLNRLQYFPISMSINLLRVILKNRTDTASIELVFKTLLNFSHLIVEILDLLPKAYVVLYISGLKPAAIADLLDRVLERRYLQVARTILESKIYRLRYNSKTLMLMANAIQTGDAPVAELILDSSKNIAKYLIEPNMLRLTIKYPNESIQRLYLLYLIKGYQWDSLEQYLAMLLKANIAPSDNLLRNEHAEILLPFFIYTQEKQEKTNRDRQVLYAQLVQTCFNVIPNSFCMLAYLTPNEQRIILRSEVTGHAILDKLKTFTTLALSIFPGLVQIIDTLTFTPLRTHIEDVVKMLSEFEGTFEPLSEEENQQREAIINIIDYAIDDIHKRIENLQVPIDPLFSDEWYTQTNPHPLFPTQNNNNPETPTNPSVQNVARLT